QDYNTFFLKDNSIIKVHSVNRMFSGQSRYAKLHDPSGLYENVRILGEDGRLYQVPTGTTQIVSANLDVLTLESLISQYLRPIIENLDKQILYYTEYPEIILPTDTTWHQTSIFSGVSRGQVKESGSVVAVGS